MTIQELEKRSGLERATIRYYEKEGLLSPARLANGYRDYSEEDALALEKIALLRQLGLSLEDIRHVQRGETPLSLALERQEDALHQRQAETASALAISRAIRSAGTSYHTLEPEKYKRQLPPPQTPPLQPPKSAFAHWQEPAAGHPWMRWMARGLDQSLYAIPAVLLMMGTVPWWRSRIYSTLAGIVGILLMLILEPLLLCTWGWTPGKWLMGLRVRLGNGKKLSFSDGVYRVFEMLLHGQGLRIPIAQLICGYLSYRRCFSRQNAGGPPTLPREQPWDENEFDYHLESRPAWMRALVPVCSVALSCLIALALWGQMQLPHRQEALTPQQYAENVNHILTHQFQEDAYRLQPDGTLTGSEPPPIRQKIGTEDGFVTSVSQEYPLDPSGKEHLRFYGPMELEYASVAALTGGKLLNLYGSYSLAAENGRCVLETNGWRVEYIIRDMPENFSQLYSYVGYRWEYIAPETPLPSPIPRLQMVIERTT